MYKLLLLLLSMEIALSASSQLWLEGKETSAMKIKVGLKVGVALTNGRADADPNSDPTPGKPQTMLGAAGGFFARIQLGKNACFQPELIIIGKGIKQQDQYGSSYPFRTTYLELPLNVIYKPITPKGSFFVGGGPAPAIYIGDNAFYYGYEPFKTFDFGVNILAGYEIPIGFSINLHYTHGLSTISNEPANTGDPNFSKVRNRCFGLMIGYIF